MCLFIILGPEFKKQWGVFDWKWYIALVNISVTILVHLSNLKIWNVFKVTKVIIMYLYHFACFQLLWGKMRGVWMKIYGFSFADLCDLNYGMWTLILHLNLLSNWIIWNGKKNPKDWTLLSLVLIVSLFVSYCPKVLKLLILSRKWSWLKPIRLGGRCVAPGGRGTITRLHCIYW